MDADTQIKQQVREFYNQVGWKTESDGFYQNASYEDLRPVSHEYIHKCHLRVVCHLKPGGHFLLDIGSGPIQYPEYLEYSQGYQRRVCADISFLALQEARKRIGDHGVFVVCDIANLPFRSEVFDGEVSLHTIHHLPPQEHIHAFQELHRTLATHSRAVIVNAWDKPPLIVFLNSWIGLSEKLSRLLHLRSRQHMTTQTLSSPAEERPVRGTYVRKQNAAWLKWEVGSLMTVQIWCWRSVSVRFLRTFIHPHLAGKTLLRLIYWLEDRFPHFFGKNGQYPLIVLVKE
jgi:SAM-dependent methyltransferase